MNVDEEVGRLKEEIQRLGQSQPDGSFKLRRRRRGFAELDDGFDSDKDCVVIGERWQPAGGSRLVGRDDGFQSTEKGKSRQARAPKVKFGILFNDDRCANIFEALVGTLRAAKKRKIVKFDGELLLQGVHDNVEITLLPSPPAEAVSVTAS